MRSSILRLLAASVLALVAMSGARHADAEGIVVEARSPGSAGMQMDAAELSPSAVGAAGIEAVLRTHAVQDGETLSAIAERYKVSTAALAALNGLSDPDRIQVGQTLKLDERGSARLRLPSNGEVTRLQLWPWPPKQGQTLVVWLETRQPLTVTVALEGQDYPVLASGRFSWSLIPLGPLAAPGVRSLAISADETRFAVPIELVPGTFSSYDVPAAVTGPILGQTSRVNDEAERVAALFAVEGSDHWGPRSRFELPLSGDFPHSDPFGSRRTYGGGGSVSAHAGEDFSATTGTPVYAPAAGTVLLAEKLLVRGNAVILDHGEGVVTGYWHLDELAVERGERVEAGQVLGAVGTTGLSTGAHLHWELRIRGVAVDPMQWVEPSNQ